MARSTSAQSQDNIARQRAGLPPVYHDPSGAGPVGGTGPGGVYNGGHYQTPTAYMPPVTKNPAVAQSTTAPAAPDPLAKPGTAEDWYAKNAWRWSQPSDAANYWAGTAGNFTNRYNPGYTGDQYNAATGALGKEQQGAQNAQAASGWFRDTPGSGEQYAQDAIGSGYFSTPGAMEQYNTQNGGQLAGPMAGETSARGFQQGFQAPGAAESNYGDAKSALSGINYGIGAIGVAANAAGQARNTQNFFGGAIAPFSQGNTVGDESGYFMPGLEGKSYSEQLMDTGANGQLLAPYQRAQEVQTRQLRDAAAARGMFNSGASMRNEEELGKDIASQSAQAEIGLAQQADASRIARTGAAQSFSQAAGQEALGRMGLGLTGAEASDTSTRANADELQKAFGMASQEGLDKVNLGTQAGSAAEQAMISRLFQGGQLGLSADQDAQNRLLAGGTLANEAQQAGDNRYKTGYDIASGGQQLGEQRMMDSSATGLAADASDLQRMQALFGMGQGMDAANLGAAQFGMQQDIAGFGMASQVDQQRYQQMLDEYNMASGVQNQFQGRQQQDWNQGFQLANAQAGLTSGGLSHATDEQGQIALEQIQNLVNQGALSQQQGQQMLDQLYGASKLVLQAKGGGK